MLERGILFLLDTATGFFTALLLPPSLVAGLFGMNLPGLPFAHSAHGLAFALLLGAASSVGVYLLLRRMGVARST